MKTNLNIKFNFLLLCFLLIATCSNAQSILFQEDFEGGSITSLVNLGDSTLVAGSSPCGKGSRGNASDFNSTNVDFQSAQNSTYYLGVNPESPCGGYYWANNIVTGTLDFSSATDSIVFECSYFQSSTLNWGPTGIEFIFSNGTTTDTIKNVFITTDNWDNIRVQLPASMMSTSVTMKIRMGGGNGVAVDNINILGYNSTTTTDITKLKDNTISIYPNPTKNTISWNSPLEGRIDLIGLYTLSGQEVMSFKTQKTSLDLSELPTGVYFLKIDMEDGKIYRTKIIKE